MIIERIQNLMANPDMGRLWRTYVTVARDHADSINEAYEDGYFDRPHATSYCSRSGCKRQAAYKALLVQGEPFQWRAYNTFAFGYCIELMIKAQMIHCEIDYEDHQSFPLSWYLDDQPIYCSPDCYNVSLGDGRLYVVELKSAASGTFDAVQRNGLRSEIPGYYDQVQLEIKASGNDAGILIMQNKNTSHLLEVLIEPDETRLAELDALFLDIHNNDKPEALPRAFALKERTTYHRGKTPPITNRPLRERLDKNGNTIGWDEILPESDLFWQCGYCAWKHQCWAPAKVVNVAPEGDKPIWEVRGADSQD